MMEHKNTGDSFRNFFTLNFFSKVYIFKKKKKRRFSFSFSKWNEKEKLVFLGNASWLELVN